MAVRFEHLNCQVSIYLSASQNLSIIAGEHKITDAGFQFLLMDTYSQLWTLLKKYIALAQAMPGTDVNGKVANWSSEQRCLD